MTAPLRAVLPCLLALALAGCGVDLPDVPSFPDELSTLDSDLSAKSGSYTVTVTNWAKVTKSAAGETEVVFSGRSSRLLSQAFSFVPDDAFGEAAASGRTFTAALRYGHETNSILSGLPLLVRLQAQSGTPDTHFAQLTAVPAARGFSGSRLIYVSQKLEPVYSRDPHNPLRYRLEASVPTTATAVRVVLGGTVTLDAFRLGSGPEWAADLTFTQLETALHGGLRVQAQAPGHVYEKSMSLGVLLSQLQLTAQDPYDTWPPPSCSASVRACVQSNPGDVGACGVYREVQVCVAEEPCVLKNRPLELVELSWADLETARLAYNQGSKSYVWGNAQAVRGFAVMGCDLSLEAVVTKLAETEQGAPTFAEGSVVPQLPGSITFFGTGYSTGGPSLWQAAQTFGDAPAQAWYSSSPKACHNCTESQDRAVLWFPATSRAVVIDGVHGWDS